MGQRLPENPTGWKSVPRTRCSLKASPTASNRKNSSGPRRQASDSPRRKRQKRRIRRKLGGFSNGGSTGSATDLEHVRLCQKTAEAERMVRGVDPLLWGFIFLMTQLRPVRGRGCYRYEEWPDGPHKIGATMRPFKMRSNELWRERLRSVCKYATVVPFELEKALQLHFDEYRIKRGEERQKGQRKNKAGETFRLPLPEVEAFNQTVAKVEKWVLLSVEAKLELEILHAEAILARSEGDSKSRAVMGE